MKFKNFLGLFVFAGLICLTANFSTAGPPHVAKQSIDFCIVPHYDFAYISEPVLLKNRQTRAELINLKSDFHSRQVLSRKEYTTYQGWDQWPQRSVKSKGDKISEGSPG